MTRVAWSRICCPVVVMTMPLPWRSNKVAPSSFSRSSNLSAQRRLSDVELIRGFAQASQFGNVNQSFQLTDVHVPHPSG